MFGWMNSESTNTQLTNFISCFLNTTSDQQRKNREEGDEGGSRAFLRIPISTLLNSGNFSSTTSEKSSFLDQYSGKHLVDFENL